MCAENPEVTLRGNASNFMFFNKFHKSVIFQEGGAPLHYQSQRSRIFSITHIPAVILEKIVLFFWFQSIEFYSQVTTKNIVQL